jgi:hypothetical protein
VRLKVRQMVAFLVVLVVGYSVAFAAASENIALKR